MIKKLGAKDAAEITFVRELAEHGTGGAAHGVLEIYRIGQVHSQCQPIDCHKQPFAWFVHPPWKQHEHNPQGIGVYYG